MSTVFIDYERDFYRARAPPAFLVKLFPEAPMHSFFLEVVFFLSCIGTASVWEDVSKAVSLTPSHEVSTPPPGNFI